MEAADRYEVDDRIDEVDEENEIDSDESRNLRITNAWKKENMDLFEQETSEQTQKKFEETKDSKNTDQYRENGIVDSQVTEGYNDTFTNTGNSNEDTDPRDPEFGAKKLAKSTSQKFKTPKTEQVETFFKDSTSINSPFED